MKTIRLNRIKMEGCVEELRNEIAIMRDLDHPHIVRAIETFEWKGEISIVMELCSGGDLYDRDPYTEAEAARIINSVLGAVAHMHSRNIIHRDLKFENILGPNNNEVPHERYTINEFGYRNIQTFRFRF